MIAFWLFLRSLYDYGTSWCFFIIVAEDLWLGNFPMLPSWISLWLWYSLCPFYECETSCVFSMTVKLPGASLWLRCDTSLGLSCYDFMGSTWLWYFLGHHHNYSWKYFAYHSDIWYISSLYLRNEGLYEACIMSSIMRSESWNTVLKRILGSLYANRTFYVSVFCFVFLFCIKNYIGTQGEVCTVKGL